MPDLSDTLRKCRIGTAKNFTLLLLLYHTQAKVKGLFYMYRLFHKKRKMNPADDEYWYEKGYVSGKPWKRGR